MSLVEYAEQEFGLSRAIIAAHTLSTSFADNGPEQRASNRALVYMGLPALDTITSDDDTANAFFHFSDGSVVKAVFIEVGKGAE